MKEEEWKLLDRKAMSVVRLSLSRNVAYHSTRDVCEAICSEQGVSDATSFQLEDVRDYPGC